MADTRSIVSDLSDNSEGPDLRAFLSDPEPDPRTQYAHKAVWWSLLGVSAMFCFFLAAGLYHTKKPQCINKLPMINGSCCAYFNGTNGCPVINWTGNGVNVKRDLEPILTDLANFDAEFITVDLRDGNAETAGVDIQALTTIDIAAEATPTPFAVPAPYMNAQHAMKDLELAGRHKGPTTTTNGFRSPSSTATTFATSTLASITVKSTNFPPPSTTATMKDVTAQATRLLHTQQLMSSHQSSHHELMNHYIQHLQQAFDNGNHLMAMIILSKMFNEMGVYERFLEDIVDGLDLEELLN